jgi:hypothetical protein
VQVREMTSTAASLTAHFADGRVGIPAPRVSPRVTPSTRDLAAFAIGPIIQ